MCLLFKKNLISVVKFCKFNHVSVEVFSDSFVVKDQPTGMVLFKSRGEGDVYVLPVAVTLPSCYLPSAKTSVKTSSSNWHNRLGHPSNKALQHVLKTYHLSCSSNSLFPCNSCSCNKSHRLPFGQTSSSSTRPLELLYTMFADLVLLNPLMDISIT